MRSGSTYSIKEKILKPGLSGVGYLTVALCKDMLTRTHKVHVLVAMCFHNHKPDKFNLVVNHIDFNKTNNNYDNLEIVTQRENSSKIRTKYLKTSKYTGVTKCKWGKKWIATICINNKYLYLGRYDDEYQAHLAYKKRLNEYLITKK